MDSIEVLAIELSQEDARSNRVKEWYDFESQDYDAMNDSLEGKYEMDSDNIIRNINELVSKHEFKSTKDEVTNAFIAIVETIINSEDIDLVMFCCECLFRWPNLAILPMQLEFDVLDTAFNTESFISACALSQLFIHCDKYKLAFLNNLTDFMNRKAYVAIGLLQNIQDSGQLYTVYCKKVVNELFDLMWKFDDSYLWGFALGFILNNMGVLKIDKTMLANLLRDEDKCEFAISVFRQMLEENMISDEDANYWIDIALDVGTDDCISLASSLYNQNSKNPSINNYQLICRLVEFSKEHPAEVARALYSVNVNKDEIAHLKNKYPSEPLLLSLFYYHKREIDFNAYLARCLENENNIKDVLVGLTYIHADEIPLIMDYVGKYKEANEIIVNFSKERYFLESLKPPHRDKLIRQCIEGINVIHSVEIIKNLLTRNKPYADALWPALASAESSYERAALMISLCEFEEYESQATEHYPSWIPYLHDIFDKDASILDRLPLGLFTNTVLHLTEQPGEVSVEHFFHCSKSQKVCRILADYCIDSDNHKELWALAQGRLGFYAQEMAWLYCDKSLEDSLQFVHFLLLENRLKVPSDKIADKFLRICFSKFDDMGDQRYIAKVAAFLYNNTNVPLHIGLLKEIVDKFDTTLFFSFFVKNLESDAQKQEVLPCILKALFFSDGNSIMIMDIIKSIDTDCIEELKVLYDSIDSYNSSKVEPVTIII